MRDAYRSFDEVVEDVFQSLYEIYLVLEAEYEREQARATDDGMPVPLETLI